VSYDLCFWSQRPEVRLPARTIYLHLLDGKAVDGLVPLAVEDYLRVLAEAFPEGTREPNGSSEWFVWEGADSMLEVWWSPVHVEVAMRPLNEDHANRLIDIAMSFGMPLYDPQIVERFRLPGD
jgi:hypothetical protein